MKHASKLVLALAIATVPAAALAHHGWSTYEPTQDTTLEAAVEAVRYRNPHAEIDLTVNGQKWLVTLAPLARMDARGVTEAVLKPGTKVRVVGKKSLVNGRYEIKAESITVNGRTSGLRA